MIQRNFNTSQQTKGNSFVYVTIPEKLKDFQDRINSYTNDGWRLHSIISELINNASCPIFVLVRDN